MKYKKIRIKNFKWIHDVEVDFSYNRILTLVWLNESWKTTILEAINLYYSLLKWKTLSQTELNEIRPKWTEFTGNIELTWDLEFEDADYEVLNTIIKSEWKKGAMTYPKDFSYTFKFQYSVHEYKNLKTEAGFVVKSGKSLKTLYTSDNDLWNTLVRATKTTLIPEILYYEDFIFEIPDKIVFGINDTDYSSTTDLSQKEWKLVFDDIIHTVSDNFTSFQKSVVAIWHIDNDTARQRLARMEKILDEKITKAWKGLFDESEQKESQRLNFKEIKLVPIWESTESISFSFKVKTESWKEFSLNERSKGCKWFFSFLIFTEFRKNRTNNILFLLDEPASNLHSSAQVKILDAISALSDKSVILYSTHSQYLINPVWLNGAYIVINNGISSDNLEWALTDTDTKIVIERYYNYVTNSKQNLQTLYFQPILDRLDYKPSLIDAWPSLFISEWKYDWYTYKYINEVILDSKFKINVYPWKWANNNGDIIRLYLAWWNKFLVILDSDTQWIEAKDIYIKDIGAIIESKIFTFQDILWEKLVMEDFFSKEDKEIIIETAFWKEKLSSIKTKEKLKSTFNFAIIQLLISKIPVKLDSETMVKFEKIFKFVVGNL